MGTFGSTSIATERAPAYCNEDVSVSKRFHIKEGYNLANLTMFSPPKREVSSPSTFGRISGQANNPRNVQLALKYIF